MAPRPESADFHERLGIEPEASPDEIKKAFRTLAREHHPDVGGNEESFKRILEAKDVLMREESPLAVREAPEAPVQTESNPTEPQAEERAVSDRIETLRDELRSESADKESVDMETKPTPPDTEPPSNEDGGGGGGGGSSWHEWGTDYEPCPTCYRKLRYIFLRCPQCKGRGSIPKRSWQRSSSN